MSVELFELMQLVLGQRKFLTIGNLPFPVRTHFGCNPGVIYLRHQEALHIFNDHSDVGPNDALLIGLAVERGCYYQDPKRPNCATAIWHNPETGKPYQVGLKVVGTGEVWVATYHHTNDRKIRQRYKTWAIIAPVRAERGAGGRPG